MKKQQFIEDVWGEDSTKHPIPLDSDTGYNLWVKAGRPENFYKKVETKPYSSKTIDGTLTEIARNYEEIREEAVMMTLEPKEDKAKYLLEHLDKHKLSDSKLKETTSTEKIIIDLDNIRRYIINNPEVLKDLFPDYLNLEETEEEEE